MLQQLFYRGRTAAAVYNNTLKNLYFLHLSRVGILFFNLSIYKKAVATYLFHSLQLNEQATPLLRPEIHNQLIKPLRRRGKIPCQALDAEVLRRLAPDELSVKSNLIAF